MYLQNKWHYRLTSCRVCEIYLAMTSEQLQAAYTRWFLRHYGHGPADQEVIPFLDKSIDCFSLGKRSWLKDVREGLFLSTGRVAQELGISRSAYAKLEKSEKRGSISLCTLAEAAKAMDCELVYAIRPKKRVRFSQVIWQALQKVSINHRWVLSRPEVRKVNALVAVANWNLDDPHFRRHQGWSER